MVNDNRGGRAVGSDGVPFQLRPCQAGDYVAYLVHALPAQAEYLVEVRVGVWVEAPAARTGEPRSPRGPTGGTGGPSPSPSAAASSPWQAQGGGASARSSTRH